MKTKIVYKDHKKTIAELKKDLVRELHKFIKLRDSINGWGNCISCDTPTPAKGGNAGHFLPSTYTALKFDANNIHLQCVACNVWRRGNIVEYRPRLIKKIGKEAVEDLEARRHDGLKQSRDWYENMIKIYQSKVKELSNL